MYGICGLVLSQSSSWIISFTHMYLVIPYANSLIYILLPYNLRLITSESPLIVSDWDKQQQLSATSVKKSLWNSSAN